MGQSMISAFILLKVIENTPLALLMYFGSILSKASTIEGAILVMTLSASLRLTLYLGLGILLR